MKTSNLSSLSGYKVKRIGLIFASYFIALEIAGVLTGNAEHINLTYINTFILLSLAMAVFSKEKVDDERTQKIRYFSLKLTFNLLITSIALFNIFKLNLEIIYVAISSLIFFLVVFHLANYFNPEFIFKEETGTSKIKIRIMVGIMVFMGLMFTLDVVLQVFF